MTDKMVFEGEELEILKKIAEFVVHYHWDGADFGCFEEYGYDWDQCLKYIHNKDWEGLIPEDLREETKEMLRLACEIMA